MRYFFIVHTHILFMYILRLKIIIIKNIFEIIIIKW